MPYVQKRVAKPTVGNRGAINMEMQDTYAYEMSTEESQAFVEACKTVVYYTFLPVKMAFAWISSCYFDDE